MRSLFVVIGPPLFDLSLRVCQVYKPVRIQALLPEPAVETLDEGILHRLSRLDKLQANMPLFAPGCDCPPPKLWSIVHDDHFRPAPLGDYVLQDTSDPHP